MSKFLLFLLACFIIISGLSFAQGVQKRVLIEQHTGAWSGWCPLGFYVMDGLLKNYGDKVIGVRLHNGDNMFLNEQLEIAGNLGMTALPSATVNRKSFNGQTFLDQNSWQKAIDSELAVPPVVDISLNYDIDEQNKIILTTIHCTPLKDLPEDLYFNVYVVEDSVSGIGSGWDQVNLVSNAPGYESNPYFKLPSPITNFQHMKVVRKLLGGAWGELAPADNPANAGETYSFTFNTAIDPKWNLEHLKFVGMVQMNTLADKSILNCAYGTKALLTAPTLLVLPETEDFGVKKSGQTFEKQFSVQNISNQTVTCSVTPSLTSRTPKDWKVSTDLTDVLILAPNDTKYVSLYLTPSDSISFGDGKLIFTDKTSVEEFSVAGESTVLSAETPNLELITQGEIKHSISQAMGNTSHTPYLQLDPEVFNDFAGTFSNLHNIIYNCGASAQLSSKTGLTISDALKNKKNLFILGNMVISSMVNVLDLSEFGINMTGVSKDGAGQAPYRIFLSGFDNDLISATFGKNREGFLLLHLLSTIGITKPSITTPVMSFAKSQDSILAVKCDFTDHKAVVMGFCHDVIAEQFLRERLISNVIDWLDGKSINGVYDENSLTGKNHISIYPNPVAENSIIKLKLDDFISKNIDISIVDINGNEVEHIASGNFIAGDYEFKLDISKMTNDIYYVVYSSGNYKESMPIIKE